jgi:hypothetical protein
MSPAVNHNQRILILLKGRAAVLEAHIPLDNQKALLKYIHILKHE